MAKSQPTVSERQVPASPAGVLPLPNQPPRPGPRWNLRADYNPLVGVIVLTIILCAVAGVVVGVILGTRANAYPNYYRIDYRLKDTYVGSTFFDNFDYFTGNDPTHGFVRYVDAEAAKDKKLTETISSVLPDLLSNSSTAVLRVDTNQKNATAGRRSVRITSRNTYDKGLFIFDIVHSPYGCGTWPALWLTDPYQWPYHGEIDVVEAVNVGDTGNRMSLHTTDGCKIGKYRRRKQIGRAQTHNCYNEVDYNAGCGVSAPPTSYGEAFNANGGGVYALELRSEGIRIWQFNRTSIPADITGQEPDPSTWGTALADFPNLECDIGKHFGNMSIIVNISLCGEWAGQQNVFSSNPMCTGMCNDYVAWRPADFEQAYWEFGGFWVYQ